LSQSLSLLRSGEPWRVAAAVPLEYGQAIVATRIPHDETVWQVLNALGNDTAIVHNKGAVMLLPAGAAKGAGLERLLAICGFSPHNLVSFGDGENDLSMVDLGEFGVAVADAVPALKEVADLITTRPDPAGVLEALNAYWLSGRTPAVPQRREHPILLGDDEAGLQICIPGATLAGSNLGVFGDSGSGKSWVTGLVAEGMHRAGYQIVVIDPEGDFRSMRAARYRSARRRSTRVSLASGGCVVVGAGHYVDGAGPERVSGQPARRLCRRSVAHHAAPQGAQVPATLDRARGSPTVSATRRQCCVRRAGAYARRRRLDVRFIPPGSAGATSGEDAAPGAAHAPERTGVYPSDTRDPPHVSGARAG